MAETPNDEAVENIYRHLLVDCPEGNLGECPKCLFRARQIVAMLPSLGYVQLDKDQSLPKPSIWLPSEDNLGSDTNRIARHYYLTAQQDMTNAKFKKVVK